MSNGLIIVGAGMHGRVVLDIANTLRMSVSGFIDDAHEIGSLIDGKPVLDRTNRLQDGDYCARSAFIVAIGNNIARRKFAAFIRARGGALAVLVHPSTTISPSATIGSGTVFVGGNMVFPSARIGQDVLVDPDTTIGIESVVENGVYICPGCHLGASVTCREESFLGIGAVVVPNVTIGRRAVIGAGAVVIRDIPDGKLAVGNPAKIIGEASLDEFTPYPARGRMPDQR